MEVFDGIGDFILKLAGYKEWGVIAVLLAVSLYQMITSRRDRLAALHDAAEKEARLAALLDHRHEKYETVFERSITALTETKTTLATNTSKIEALETRVGGMDHRCDERQLKRRGDSERKRKGVRDDA
jgi:hypothetical protein